MRTNVLVSSETGVGFLVYLLVEFKKV